MERFVYAFNQERNQFELDMELEVKMLQEEVREFFEAESLAARIDATVDVEYVWLGTQMKCSMNGALVHRELSEWIGNFNEIAGAIVLKELHALGLVYNDVIAEATDIVCRANAAKGSKLVDGKVSKENYGIDATQLIQDYLDDAQA